jgi:hypothetical protein
MMTAAGMTPDPWQTDLLRCSDKRLLLLCGRQSGKSQAAAAVALREALLRPRSLVLLLSPSQRQSGELFKDKLLPLYNALGRPVPTVQESALTMQLANGSRIVSLPGEEGTIRCYSGVRLLVVDEAARVPDALYFSVRPMLAVSRGRLIVASTPFGRRGFFYDEWRSDHSWKRIRVKTTECPRIPTAFLVEERKALGPKWFAQEYETSFEDMIGSLFSQEDIDAMTRERIPSIWS